MIDARKVKVTKASASDPKPGQQDQLEMVVDEVVALMPGDKLLVRFDQKRRTFTGLYILDNDKAG